MAIAKVHTLKGIKTHPAVKDVWKEEDGGFSEDGSSYWVSFYEGWRDFESDCTSIHEATIKDVCYRLNTFVKPEPIVMGQPLRIAGRMLN